MTASTLSYLILTAMSLTAAWGFAFLQAKDQAQYVGRLHDEHNREREQWHKERQLLLNRIKPETAQFVPNGNHEPTPQAIGMDQDDEYWMSQGMSKEDLARALMGQELEGRPE